MSFDDGFPAAWQDAEVFWSTIAYLRCWWATDGINVKAIQRAGAMTPELLREIAKEYKVNRGIPRADVVDIGDDDNDCDDDDYHRDPVARDLAALLNRDRGDWPVGLVERADRCCRILRIAQASKLFYRDQISAVTKFMWFLKPEGWTMFDRYAANGLGVDSRLPALQRMQAFYGALAERGFEEVCARMQKRIDDSAFKGLPAGRILDTLLMARGDRGGDAETVARLKDFLSLLPLDTGGQLVNLAWALQRQFGNEVLR